MTLSNEVSTARKLIYRDGYDISFGELSSLYESNELIIQPAYQRLFRWDQTQKTRFIESLLLNIPIPPIFVFSDSQGRWELVDGLQRVSTVLQFMGLLKDENGCLVEAFACDGTSLLPSLQGMKWPAPNKDESDQEGGSIEYLALPFQLAIRRTRIRVEILAQETDAHAKYELFQRLNSGGSNLSEQELRNCIVISINNKAFELISKMADDKNFKEMARVGEERIRRSYLNELVTRFLVLRNVQYKTGLDVHEYLDKGIVSISEKMDFDWTKEMNVFELTMSCAFEALGSDAFFKNNRFSLGMYEFIALGLSKSLEKDSSVWTPEKTKNKIIAVSELSEAKKYSGMGVRGTQRLSNFVIPMAESFFAG